VSRSDDRRAALANLAFSASAVAACTILMIGAMFGLIHMLSVLERLFATG
jgi:hypothetical protein